MMRTGFSHDTDDLPPAAPSVVAAVRQRVARAWSRRCRSDDGAVLVEAAMVLPLLVLVMAATFDFGVGYRNRIVMQGATRTGARAAAVMGPDPAADSFALTTLAAGLANGLTNTTMDRVVIFKTDANGTISNTCLTKATSVSGAGDATAGAQCNIYQQSQVTAAVNGTFVPANSSCTTGWDYYYCPKNRSNNLATAPDTLGVFLQMTYVPLTKMFKTSYVLTDKTVVRVEPAAG